MDAGTLEPVEFEQLLQRMSLRCDPDELRRLISLCESSGGKVDGEVDYSEFANNLINASEVLPHLVSPGVEAAVLAGRAGFEAWKEGESSRVAS